MYEGMVAAARKKGKVFLYHSCNNILQQQPVHATMYMYTVNLFFHFSIELREAEEAIKQKKKQQQKEQLAAEAQQQWSDILPKWEAM